MLCSTNAIFSDAAWGLNWPCPVSPWKSSSNCLVVFRRDGVSRYVFAPRQLSSIDLYEIFAGLDGLIVSPSCNRPARVRISLATTERASRDNEPASVLCRQGDDILLSGYRILLAGALFLFQASGKIETQSQLSAAS